MEEKYYIVVKQELDGLTLYHIESAYTAETMDINQASVYTNKDKAQAIADEEFHDFGVGNYKPKPYECKAFEYCKVLEVQRTTTIKE